MPEGQRHRFHCPAPAFQIAFLNIHAIFHEENSGTISEGIFPFLSNRNLP